ncbi:hypothetical protein B0H14DRAFT_2659453 [Mycena olivaceomarginata]|nr:hypothetical protein B0H14DRAFT_2659453 [Mycena olivaceomarginata]
MAAICPSQTLLFSGGVGWSWERLPRSRDHAPLACHGICQTCQIGTWPLSAKILVSENPICLVSGSNEFQAVSRSSATMSLAAHNLGYGKQFQGSQMSESLGTPPKRCRQEPVKKVLPFFNTLIQGTDLGRVKFRRA